MHTFITRFRSVLRFQSPFEFFEGTDADAGRFGGADGGGGLGLRRGDLGGPLELWDVEGCEGGAEGRDD